MKKVSVIIPVYNVEKYLKECIESVAKQTYTDIEIICVNDGSTDKSLEVLKQYSKTLKDFKIINKENEGLSAARNTGVRHASGYYIFFLDSDDFLHSRGVIKSLVNEAEKENLDIVIGNFTFFYEINSKNNFKFNINKNVINNIMDGIALLEKGIKTRSINSVVWNKLYRYDLVKDELFLEGLYYEDMEYTLRIFVKAKRVKMIDILTVNYRQREDSIMSGEMGFKKVIDYFNIAKHILSIRPENKFIISWAATCIVKVWKNISGLEDFERNKIINELSKLDNLSQVFSKSFLIKHKLFGIYIKVFGLKVFKRGL